MDPEYVIKVYCEEWARTFDAVMQMGEDCPRRGWRGPLCRALQVYEAFWRYKDKGEVPLDATSLGLAERHIPYLLEVQQKFGKSAPFKLLVVYYAWVLEDALRRQIVFDLAKMAGL